MSLQKIFANAAPRNYDHYSVPEFDQLRYVPMTYWQHGLCVAVALGERNLVIVPLPYLEFEFNGQWEAILEQAGFKQDHMWVPEGNDSKWVSSRWPLVDHWAQYVADRRRHN